MKTMRFSRYAVSIIAAVALLAGCSGSQPPIGAPGASSDNGNGLPYQKTFNYTGGEQTFKVPSGVTSIDVDVRGAAGAGDYLSYHGGRGGRVMATIAVYPHQKFDVFVGGEGSHDKGGFNGGGNGGSYRSDCGYGWGGGGASDVREGSDTLQDRILVAGGGGGLGYEYSGSGGGGGGGGKTGGNGSSTMYGGGGGKGGKQHKGGAGGKSSGSGHYGASGQFGTGGNGGACGYTYFVGGGGGGGGGGYFGGGGGGGGHYLSGGGGGGGGSGYVESTATKSRMWRGWKTATGNGVVVFSWQ